MKPEFKVAPILVLVTLATGSAARPTRTPEATTPLPMPGAPSGWENPSLFPVSPDISTNTDPRAFVWYAADSALAKGLAPGERTRVLGEREQVYSKTAAVAAKAWGVRIDAREALEARTNYGVYVVATAQEHQVNGSTESKITVPTFVLLTKNFAVPLPDLGSAVYWRIDEKGAAAADAKGNVFAVVDPKMGTVIEKPFATITVDTTVAGKRYTRGDRVLVQKVVVGSDGHVVQLVIQTQPGKTETINLSGPSAVKLNEITLASAVVQAPPPTATRAATLEPTPQPNILGLKTLPPEALPKIQIVPDPENKYVDRIFNLYSDGFSPYTIFISAYYDGSDVIVTVNFYNKQTGQFHPDRKVKFVNGKGKALFYGSGYFLSGTDVESVPVGTIISLSGMKNDQFEIFNSNLKETAVAATGALFFNQKIIEHPPK